MKDDGTIRWFGQSWNSPMNRDCEQVSTPVGMLCLYCEQPIREGDYGILMNSMALEDDEEQTKAIVFARAHGLRFIRRPVHYICNIKWIFGEEKAKVYELVERQAKALRDLEKNGNG